MGMDDLKASTSLAAVPLIRICTNCSKPGSLVAALEGRVESW